MSRLCDYVIRLREAARVGGPTPADLLSSDELTDFRFKAAAFVGPTAFDALHYLAHSADSADSEVCEPTLEFVRRSLREALVAVGVDLWLDGDPHTPAGCPACALGFDPVARHPTREDLC